MLKSTVAKTVCPSCSGPLVLQTTDKGSDVLSGRLECKLCKLKFPILAGVAILVEDVQMYLVEHVKGISKLVADNEIPKEFLKQYRQAKEEIQEEHIEEDLEADRVISLYFMNQYLDAKGMAALMDEPSPLIAQLIEKHWDHGPFAQIEKWIGALAQKQKLEQTIELGCGVGGLARVLQAHTQSYLGVDSSFASIALARHLTLGAPYAGVLRVPTDLLHGPVSKKVDTSEFRLPKNAAEHTDFIVADLTALPIKRKSFDATIALNAIDMLPQPQALPELQFNLLKPGGLAFQSCPYIWHETVARELRETLPNKIHNSAQASEWLYEQCGFKICEKVQHLPWLFFKHQRQLETYSVHLFYGLRA